MATWRREFKLPWREAGPPNHLADKMDSGQYVVNKELSLSPRTGKRVPVGTRGFDYDGVYYVRRCPDSEADIQIENLFNIFIYICKERERKERERKKSFTIALTVPFTLNRRS